MLSVLGAFPRGSFGFRSSGSLTCLSTTPSVNLNFATNYLPERLEPPSSVSTQPTKAKSEKSVANQACDGVEIPRFLEDLKDPRVPVALPTPAAGQHELPSTKYLDRLVRGIGAEPAIWWRCLELMKWLEDVGYPADARLYTTVIRLCCANKAPMQALFCYQRLRPHLRDRTLRTTAHTFTEAMCAALDVKAYRVAMQIWHDARVARIKRDEYLVCTFMKALLGLQHNRQVIQLWQVLVDKPGLKVPMQAHCLAMRAMTAMRNPQRALELYEQLVQDRNGQLPGHIFSAAIAALASQRDGKYAHEVFQQMREAGHIPDSVSCGALLHAYASSGAWECAERLMALMRGWNVPHTVRCFASLAAAYSRGGAWARVADLLDSAAARTAAIAAADAWCPQPSAHMLNHVINAAAAVGRFDLAEGAVSQLTGPAAHVPGNHHFPCAGVRDVRAALEGWDMEAFSLRGKKPGGPAEAEELFGSECDRGRREQRRWGFIATQSSAAPGHPPVESSTRLGAARERVASDSQSGARGGPALQKQCSSSMQADLLEELYSRAAAVITSDSQGPLKQHHRRPVRPGGARAAAAAVRTISQSPGGPTVPSAQADRVVADLIMPRAVLLQPYRSPLLTVQVWAALADAYARSGCWREATAVIGRSAAAGSTPTRHTVCSAIHAAALANEPHVARALLESIRGRPSLVAYETVAFAYAISAMPSGVEEMIAEIVKSKHKPFDYAGVALIIAYNNAGRPRAALQVRHRLDNLGIPRTVHVLNALLTVCVLHAGLGEQGLQILQDFKMEGSTVARTPVTARLVRMLCEREVSRIEKQQVAAAALSAAAAVGGVLMRSGIC